MPTSLREFNHLGLDREQLHRVRDTFVALNRARLMRARDALGERQQLFLDCLPLLLQFNHPMLPGFVSRTTPAGIEGFEPEAQSLRLLQSIAKSFRPNRSHSQTDDILALYLMGSVGTIGQSYRSDLDIWVCHRHDLSPNALAELKLKCEYLEQWATSLHLEAHFFLMNWQTVQAGKISALDGESSGTTQYFLLLDEFYRTAIHLGGRLPAWIFVPPKQEDHYELYCKTIIERRFLPERELIDFGDVAAIPASEFLSAAIWQLYKAIESPYKSVIKLLLLESYASSINESKTLSQCFKHFLHDCNHQQLTESELNYCDPYIQSYRHLECYLLNHNQSERLELVRRCFYFKVNKPLSRPPITGNRSWQREQLQSMTKEWGWTDDHLAFLDRQKDWNISQILIERKILIQALNKSYRFLLDFWQSQKLPLAATTEELNILGRKLNAAFSRKKGKIDWITPNVLSKPREAHLTFTQKSLSDGSSVWQVYSQKGNERPLKESNKIIEKGALIEAMTWCHCNGVLDKGTHCDSLMPSIPSALLDKIRLSLGEVFKNTLGFAPHKAFQTTSFYQQLVLFINIETDNEQDQTMRHISGKVDALNFGGWNKLLINQIDLVTVTSRHEIYCHQHQGDAVVQTLQLFLNDLIAGHHPMPAINIYCYNNDHRLQIQQRLHHLFNKLYSFFGQAQHKQHQRLGYIIEIAGNYHTITLTQDEANIQQHNDLNQLLQYLGKAQPQYVDFCVDEYALRQHPLPTLYNYNQADTLQVFFHPQGEKAQLYILDERGSLFSSSIDYTMDMAALKPLHYFLRNCIEQQAPQYTQGPLGIYPIHFYELTIQQGQWRCVQRAITTDTDNEAGFSISASAEWVDGKLRFSLYCDGEEFSHPLEQATVFTETATYILAKRRESARYHCYITDLDLSRCQHQLNQGKKLQTIHYLHVKSLIERKITRALQAL